MNILRRHGFLILLLGITAVLLISSLTPDHNWGDDFAGYVSQAASLFHGTPQTYLVENRFTIEQSSYAFGPVAYPWGFPAMLAPLYAWFGLDPIALKSIGVLSVLLLVPVLWFGFRRNHTDFWLVSLICLFSLNPQIIGFSNNILSDLPFLLLSTVSLFIIGRVIVRRDHFFNEFWDHIMVGVLIAAAYFIRENGILLLIVLVVSQLITYLQSGGIPVVSPFQSASKFFIFPSRLTTSSVARRTCAVIVHILPLLTFIVMVTIWERILPSEGSAHAFKSVSLSTIKHNIIYYINLPYEFFSNVAGGYLLYWLSIPLVVIGILKRFKTEHHIILFIVLTFALYIVWPVPQGLRYIFPILPFFFSFMISGLQTLQRPNNCVLKFLPSLPVIVINIIFAANSILALNIGTKFESAGETGAFGNDSIGMYDYIRKHTDPDCVVVFFKPRLMKLMTDRRSILIDNVEQLPRGDYLCLKNGGYDQINLRELANLGISPPIFKSGKLALYRLRTSVGDGLL